MCARVCVFVRVPACINSLRSGWLCSQTPQSGCIATNSPPLPVRTRSFPISTPPPPHLSERAFELMEGTGEYSHLRHHVIGAFDLSVSVRVCDAIRGYACPLSVDFT